MRTPDQIICLCLVPRTEMCHPVVAPHSRIAVRKRTLHWDIRAWVAYSELLSCCNANWVPAASRTCRSWHPRSTFLSNVTCSRDGRGAFIGTATKPTELKCMVNTVALCRPALIQCSLQENSSNSSSTYDRAIDSTPPLSSKTNHRGRGRVCFGPPPPTHPRTPGMAY